LISFHLTPSKNCEHRPLIIPHVLVAQLNLYVDNSKGNELI